MEAGEARAAAARGKVRIGSQATRRLGLCAVINGVLAAPVMIIMMLLVRRKSVMGDLVKGRFTGSDGSRPRPWSCASSGMAMSMWS